MKDFYFDSESGRFSEREAGTVYVAWSELDSVIHPPLMCGDCSGTGRFVGRSPEMGLNLDFAPCTTCDGTGERTPDD